VNIRNVPNIAETIVLGAVGMYFCDPVLGRRRRALARDKIVRLRKTIKETADVNIIRDFKNRTWGTALEGRATFLENGVDDAVLVARVRSELGFLVRNPSSIALKASEGRVTLTGAVFTHEVQQLLDGVRSVRGVRHVEDFLVTHEVGDNKPGHQGDNPKPSRPLLDVFQRRSAPSTRFLLVSAGIALLFELNLFRRTTAGLAMLAGLALLACSVAEEQRKERERSEWRNDEMDATAGRS
jgi:hyperosmotically inducible periplasmic protein